MRIIAGHLGGRQFHEPHGHHTHPMSEKVRGALFNALGDIEGLTVLDAFAGSGGLSLEAISRGAKNSVAIDKDRPAHVVLVRNVQELGMNKQIKAIRANVSGWSDNNPRQKFDIALLDPPYDDLQFNLLEKLVSRHMVASGIAVLSWPGHIDIPSFDGLEMVSNKNYGDAQLVFYRKL